MDVVGVEYGDVSVGKVVGTGVLLGGKAVK